jgi:hypothetical protein
MQALMTYHKYAMSCIRTEFQYIPSGLGPTLQSSTWSMPRISQETRGRVLDYVSAEDVLNDMLRDEECLSLINFLWHKDANTHTRVRAILGWARSNFRA